MPNCILTPCYIHAGALYELYEYELNIRLTDQPDFHRYLLKKTGRKAVEDIPDHIGACHKNAASKFQKPRDGCRWNGSCSMRTSCVRKRP